MTQSRSSLETLANLIEAINERIGRAISWLTVFMVVITFLVVVLRYAFNTGWIAMQESVTYMHALVFMLGAAYTLKHDGHVRVDIFYRAMSPRGQAWVDLAGSLFLLGPVCVFIVWVSWDYVAASWAVRETSPEAGGIPAVYLLKTIVPITAGLLTLQGVGLIINSCLVLLGLRPPSAKRHEENV